MKTKRKRRKQPKVRVPKKYRRDAPIVHYAPDRMGYWYVLRKDGERRWTELAVESSRDDALTWLIDNGYEGDVFLLANATICGFVASPVDLSTARQELGVARAGQEKVGVKKRGEIRGLRHL